MRTIRIGSGAGYSGDRIEPAVELALNGKLNYLIFECLAERTIALAQQNKRQGLSEGFDPLLAERLLAVLPACREQGITIISNMGAANPLAAARKAKEIAQSLGLRGLRIAAIQGDNVLPLMPGDFNFLETGEPISASGRRLISANAYLGAAPIVEALASEADIILTGRAADPSLFLAPLMHEFGWRPDDWDLLAKGTMIGHLLECAGQLTGGYYADPGYKDVPNLARLGFPLAEVESDGSAVLTKVEGSGGVLTRGTCIEQLLYEIQDPAAYLTPDVIADFSGVSFLEVGRDRIKVDGATGRPKTTSLKVSVGFDDHFVGEGQISYAGPGAVARASLAEQVLRERIRKVALDEVRFDLIGLNSIHGSVRSSRECEPHEVRLRVAARAQTAAVAAMIPREVEALYTNGPAGGGGVFTSLREIVAILSTLIPAAAIEASIHLEVS